MAKRPGFVAPRALVQGAPQLHALHGGSLSLGFKSTDWWTDGRRLVQELFHDAGLLGYNGFVAGVRKSLREHHPLSYVDRRFAAHHEALASSGAADADLSSWKAYMAEARKRHKVEGIWKIAKTPQERASMRKPPSKRSRQISGSEDLRLLLEIALAALLTAQSMDEAKDEAEAMNYVILAYQSIGMATERVLTLRTAADREAARHAEHYAKIREQLKKHAPPYWSSNRAACEQIGPYVDPFKPPKPADDKKPGRHDPARLEELRKEHERTVAGRLERLASTTLSDDFEKYVRRKGKKRGRRQKVDPQLAAPGL